MSFPGMIYPGTVYPQNYVVPDGALLVTSTRVLVNGVQREAFGWSIERELSGDLPKQIVSVSGITQAAGSVEWAATADVPHGASNPWNASAGWVPRRGDRIEIFVGTGPVEHKQFHGVIDTTSGSVGGGLTSTIIDDFDRLSAKIAHEPMLRIMPPVAWDGSEPYRGVGMSPLYYVDLCFRQAGFYCTPQREYNTELYVPMQGSVWPHYGSVYSSADFLNTQTPWGLGMRGGAAEFRTATSRPMSVPTQLSLMVAPDHASTAEVFLDYGDASNSLRMSVTSSRVVRALKNGVEVCRLSLGDAVLVSMLAKDGVISLRTNTGESASGTFTPSGPNMSGVRINLGADSSVAGLQISRPELAGHEHASTRVNLSARIDTTSLYLNGILDAVPEITSQPASDLLQEIGSATMSAMWIDEQGILQWSPSNALRARPSTVAVSTLDHILSLDWEDGLMGTASRVTVKGRKPAITKGRWRNVELDRGSGASLKSKDEQSIIFEPGTDEDWIMPHTNPQSLGGSENIWGPYNNPSYSIVGLYYTSDGGTTTISGLNCEITTEVLGPQKFLVKYLAGDWPSDVEGVLATSPTNENLWPKNRNQDLPRLVGRGKVKWVDQEVMAIGAGGPGPELTHDAGVWANRDDSTEMLERYASYLQAQTAAPKPVITGLGIVPDPSIKLGEVITINSPDLLGVTISALVVGVSLSHGDQLSQSLSVRIIDVKTTHESYGSFGSGANLTYSQWQALGPALQSYGQFNES